MAFKKLDNLEIEGARVIYRNFSGKPTTFNPKGGDHTFCVVIDDATAAQKLLDDGWNIRIRAPRDEEDQPMYYMTVKVRFDNIPPHVYMVTSRNKTMLNEESIGNLDYAEIANADLVIRPYNWSRPDGNSGVTAYLKTGYFVIEEDVFASKYAEEEYPGELPFD